MVREHTCVCRAGKYLLITIQILQYSPPTHILKQISLRLYFLQPSAPTDPPMEVTAMATNPVSILIRWGRVLCINRNSNITRYAVRYSTSGGSPMSVSASGTGQNERTYNATLLAPSTSYSIQVAAVTNTGVTGPFSTTVTETTPPPRSESVRYTCVCGSNSCQHNEQSVTQLLNDFA